LFSRGHRPRQICGICLLFFLQYQWDSIDLNGKRLFIERQANRRGEDAATKTEASVRPIPIPAFLVPELKRWNLACPTTVRGLVFPGEPNTQGERNPIDADILLRNILRRALRKAGLPALRFHDRRHTAGTLLHEAGVPTRPRAPRSMHSRRTS
jgi:integrase